jgi:hypothetical protein
VLAVNVTVGEKFVVVATASSTTLAPPFVASELVGKSLALDAIKIR